MNYQQEIEKLFNYIERNTAIYELWGKVKPKYTCFYGAGKVCCDELFLFENTGHPIDFLCDSDSEKWQKEYHGYKCISPEELKQYGNDVLILINVINYMPIYNQLKAMGLTHVYPAYRWMRFDNYKMFESADWIKAARNDVTRTIDMWSDDLSKETFLTTIRNRVSVDLEPSDCSTIEVEDEQYFVNDIIKLSNDESFVDVGAYVGDTLKSFISHTNGSFSHAYLYELSKANYEKIEEYIETLSPQLRERISYYNMGAWDCKKEITCSGFGTGCTVYSSDCDNISEKGYVDALDNLIGDKRITYLKMDIEGSEINALEGSKSIIQTQHPKLAICAYHLLEHLLKVPGIIYDMNPEYNLYLRHHSSGWGDTVCYAF